MSNTTESSSSLLYDYGESIDELFIKQVLYTRLNLIKEIIESEGYDFDTTENQIEYHNELMSEIENGNLNLGLIKGLIESGMIGKGMCCGDFNVPAEVMAYVKQMVAEGFVHRSNLVPNSKLSIGKSLADGLVKSGFSSMGALAVCGAFYVECGWNANVVNKQELNGGGVSGTSGYANCGEGLFGLTFWSQKLPIIQALKLKQRFGVPDTKEEYNKASAKHLYDLDISVWGEMFNLYINKKPAIKQILCSSNDSKTIIAASYIQKAGNFGSGINWDAAVKTSGVYRRSHAEKNKIKNVHDGLACQILASMKLAAYISGQEIDLSFVK